MPRELMMATIEETIQPEKEKDGQQLEMYNSNHTYA